MYNFRITLGDPGGDGHGKYRDFRFESNYSIDDIEEAYKKATELIGFDYCKEICSEYEDCIMWCEYVEKLENFGITFHHLDKEDDGSICLNQKSYIDIFFNIIQLILKDFTFKLIPDIPELSCTRGAGYGLFGD